MNDYSTFSRARLQTMLRDYGLDQPLDEHDLTLQFLDTELRLERLDRRVSAAESVSSRL